MKPVKNKYKSFFEIGKCYQFGETNIMFRIRRISSCADSTCCAEASCTRMIINDEGNGIWCGIEKDFTKISQEKYRRNHETD